VQINETTHAYRPTPGVHDEAVDHHGVTRPAWAEVLAAISHPASGGLARLRSEASRLLDGEGANHLFPDNDGWSLRPWELDPVPLLIPADEWKLLAAGIAERAGLIAAMVDDFYGEQRLLHDGSVPAEVVLGHPSFAWGAPSRLTAEVTRPRLTVYGADLVRLANGEWRVLRDLTDAPSGAGYAMLNRSVLSRLMPEVFTGLPVRSLAATLSTIRGALARCAPADRNNPRAVVMTTGAQHPSYLEHSYLASILGYHLADAGDLLARDGKMWLRTLGGLEAVDAILRRSDDDQSDPLDLGGTLGVPGLAQVSRRGGVGLVNGIGTGMAGSFAIQPFLDGAARALNGRPLRLANIDAVWCGNRDAAATVLDSLGDYVLHDIAIRNPAASVLGGALDTADEAIWRQRLVDDPARYVAQRRTDFATVPVGVGSMLQPGHVLVRVQAIEIDGTFAVLPGGLARVIDGAAPIVAQRNGAAKDIWVLDEAARRESRRTPVRIDVPQIDLRSSLPTRSAEALFWVGRRVEQAESLARLASVVLAEAQRDPALLVDPTVDFAPLVRSALGAQLGRAVQAGGGAPLEQLLAALRDVLVGPGGLSERLDAFGQAVGTVRQFVSAGTWQVVASLDRRGRQLGDVPGHPTLVSEALEATLVDLAAFFGLVAESMVRGPSWRMFDLGRRLQRALVVLGGLESLVAPGAHGNSQPEALGLFLASNESLIAYRRRYRSDPELDATLDLLVADDTNPRSLAFQLDRIRTVIAALPVRASRPTLEACLERSASVVAAASWMDADFGRPHDGRILGIDRLVLDARGPLIEMLEHLNHEWFSDRRAMRVRRVAT
jgi:uncharacterized circularly permuted ATP-grasp superfamily protein/uncharacterized alpha-E superfamily protein